MKRYRKGFLIMLTLTMVTTLFPTTGFAASNDENIMNDVSNKLNAQVQSGDFCISEGDVNITGCVQVKDGKIYVLSEEEYLDLKEKEENIRIDKKEISEISPKSITREFIPTKITKKDHRDKRVRISQFFPGNALSLTVNSTYTFSRTHTTTKGASLTASDLKFLDQQVAASCSYSISDSATTSTSMSVIGSLPTTGRYTWAAVVFEPTLVTAKGTYNVYANIMGASKIGEYQCELVYPSVGRTSNLFDGNYLVMESNNKSDFPDLA